MFTNQYWGLKDYSGLRQGFGLQTYANGSLYLGQRMNDIKDGMGAYVSPDGELQEGEFIGDKIFGAGTSVGKDGKVYSGQFQHGKREGVGQISENGTEFVGRFKSSKRHGVAMLRDMKTNKIIKGTYNNGQLQGFVIIKHLDSGYMYTGYVKDSLLHGIGEEIRDQAVYVGQFEKSLRHGIGYLKTREGISFLGEWESGAKMGFGIEEFPQGIYYEGQYTKGIKKGMGKIVDNTKNTIYVGEIGEDSLPSGFGQIQTPTIYYIGYWVKGQKQGVGYMKQINGRVYFGYWRQDKREGKGYLFDEKLEYKGYFENDLPHGSGIVKIENSNPVCAEFRAGNLVRTTNESVADMMRNFDELDFAGFESKSLERLNQIMDYIDQKREWCLSRFFSIDFDFKARTESLDSTLHQLMDEMKVIAKRLREIRIFIRDSAIQLPPEAKQALNSFTINLMGRGPVATPSKDRSLSPIGGDKLGKIGEFKPPTIPDRKPIFTQLNNYMHDKDVFEDLDKMAAALRVGDAEIDNNTDVMSQISQRIKKDGVKDSETSPYRTFMDLPITQDEREGKEKNIRFEERGEGPVGYTSRSQKRDEISPPRPAAQVDNSGKRPVIAESKSEWSSQMGHKSGNQQGREELRQNPAQPLEKDSLHYGFKIDEEAQNPPKGNKVTVDDRPPSSKPLEFMSPPTKREIDLLGRRLDEITGGQLQNRDRGVGSAISERALLKLQQEAAAEDQGDITARSIAISENISPKKKRPINPHLDPDFLEEAPDLEKLNKEFETIKAGGQMRHFASNRKGRLVGSPSKEFGTRLPTDDSAQREEMIKQLNQRTRHIVSRNVDDSDFLNRPVPFSYFDERLQGEPARSSDQSKNPKMIKIQGSFGGIPEGTSEEVSDVKNQLPHFGNKNSDFIGQSETPAFDLTKLTPGFVGRPGNFGVDNTNKNLLTTPVQRDITTFGIHLTSDRLPEGTQFQSFQKEEQPAITLSAVPIQGITLIGGRPVQRTTLISQPTHTLLTVHEKTLPVQSSKQSTSNIGTQTGAMNVLGTSILDPLNHTLSFSNVPGRIVDQYGQYPDRSGELGTIVSSRGQNVHFIGQNNLVEDPLFIVDNDGNVRPVRRAKVPNWPSAESQDNSKEHSPQQSPSPNPETLQDHFYYIDASGKPRAIDRQQTLHPVLSQPYGVRGSETRYFIDSSGRIRPLRSDAEVNVVKDPSVRTSWNVRLQDGSKQQYFVDSEGVIRKGSKIHTGDNGGSDNEHEYYLDHNGKIRSKRTGQIVMVAPEHVIEMNPRSSSRHRIAQQHSGTQTDRQNQQGDAQLRSDRLNNENFIDEEGNVRQRSKTPVKQKMNLPENRNTGTMLQVANSATQTQEISPQTKDINIGIPGQIDRRFYIDTTGAARMKNQPINYIINPAQGHPLHIPSSEEVSPYLKKNLSSSAQLTPQKANIATGTNPAQRSRQEGVDKHDFAVQPQNLIAESFNGSEFESHLPLPESRSQQVGSRDSGRKSLPEFEIFQDKDGVSHVRRIGDVEERSYQPMDIRDYDVMVSTERGMYLVPIARDANAAMDGELKYEEENDSLNKNRDKIFDLDDSEKQDYENMILTPGEKELLVRGKLRKVTRKVDPSDPSSPEVVELVRVQPDGEAEKEADPTLQGVRKTILPTDELTPGEKELLVRGKLRKVTRKVDPSDPSSPEVVELVRVQPDGEAEKEADPTLQGVRKTILPTDELTPGEKELLVRGKLRKVTRKVDPSDPSSPEVVELVRVQPDGEAEKEADPTLQGVRKTILPTDELTPGEKELLVRGKLRKVTRKVDPSDPSSPEVVELVRVQPDGEAEKEADPTLQGVRKTILPTDELTPGEKELLVRGKLRKVTRKVDPSDPSSPEVVELVRVQPDGEAEKEADPTLQGVRKTILPTDELTPGEKELLVRGKLRKVTRKVDPSDPSSPEVVELVRVQPDGEAEKEADPTLQGVRKTILPTDELTPGEKELLVRGKLRKVTRKVDPSDPSSPEVVELVRVQPDGEAEKEADPTLQGVRKTILPTDELTPGEKELLVRGKLRKVTRKVDPSDPSSPEVVELVRVQPDGEAEKEADPTLQGVRKTILPTDELTPGEKELLVREQARIDQQIKSLEAQRESVRTILAKGIPPAEQQANVEQQIRQLQVQKANIANPPGGTSVPLKEITQN
jgi:hypothetical protein